MAWPFLQVHALLLPFLQVHALPKFQYDRANPDVFRALESCLAVFLCIDPKFDLRLTKRAFVHWYVDEAMKLASALFDFGKKLKSSVPICPHPF